MRLVLKELPVLGPESEDVARIAQAAIAQGKYLELHERLFAERGRATKQKALRIASELGLDTAKLEADMDSPGVEYAIAANKRLADRLEVEGVPFYLVGDRPLPGSGEDHSCRADRRRGGCAAAWLPGSLLNLIGPLIGLSRPSRPAPQHRRQPRLNPPRWARPRQSR